MPRQYGGSPDKFRHSDLYLCVPLWLDDPLRLHLGLWLFEFLWDGVLPSPTVDEKTVRG